VEGLDERDKVVVGCKSSIRRGNGPITWKGSWVSVGVRVRDGVGGWCMGEVVYG
jgi:hypothetical protein